MGADRQERRENRADLGSDLDSFTGEAVALGQGVLYQLILKSCLHTSSNHGVSLQKVAKPALKDVTRTSATCNAAMSRTFGRVKGESHHVG